MLQNFPYIQFFEVHKAKCDWSDSTQTICDLTNKVKVKIGKSSPNHTHCCLLQNSRSFQLVNNVFNMILLSNHANEDSNGCKVISLMLESSPKNGFL